MRTRQISQALCFSIFLLTESALLHAQRSPDSLTNKLAYIAIKEDRPAIRIGESVPFTHIDKIVHYSERNSQLDKFKGKLLILDFWHQFCSTCIAAFPKMEVLQ